MCNVYIPRELHQFVIVRNHEYLRSEISSVAGKCYFYFAGDYNDDRV